MKHEDICTMAQALARNCGFAVFPCGDDKRPTRPCPKGEEGEHGFKDASKDPDEIGWLWRNWPGPLIGIATGRISNRIVLDLDAKHDSARAFWHTYRDRLPPTLCQRTRSGGFHFYFLATTAISCSTGRNNTDLKGVDVRGEGGYVVSWFAAGFPLVRHDPPVPWPDWLTAVVQPPPLPPKRDYEPMKQRSLHNLQASIRGLLRTLAETQEGNRNAHTNWSAWHLREHIRLGHLSRREAEAMVTEAARATGLQDREIAATIRSALKEV